MADIVNLGFRVDTGPLKKAADELQRLDKAGRDLAGSTGKVDKSIRTTGAGMATMSGAAGGLSTKMSALKGVIGSLGVAKLASEYIRAADAFKSMEALVRSTTSSVQEFERAQSGLLAASRSSRTALADLSSLYVGIAPAIDEMGRSQAEALRVTELISKAMKLAGGSAQEHANATRQLVQALGSGVLRGDEFNSIMENGRGFALQLAEALDMPISALRGMAEAGELTADVVIDAMLRQGKAIDDAFKDIPVTSGEAWQQVKDNVVLAIGQIDEEIKVSDSWVDLLLAVADSVEPIADAITDLAADVSGDFSDIGAEVENLQDQFGQFGDALDDFTDGRFDWLQTGIDLFQEFYSEIKPVIDGAENLVGVFDGWSVIETAISAVAKAFEGLTAVTKYVDQVLDYVDKLAKSTEPIKQAWNDFSNWWSNLWSGLTSDSKAAEDVGEKTAKGVVVGIENSEAEIAAAGAGMGQLLIDSLAGPQGVDSQSPSRKAMEIGGFVAEGLAAGMLESLDVIFGAAIELSDAALRAITNAIGAYEDEMLVMQGNTDAARINTLVKQDMTEQEARVALAYEKGAEAIRDWNFEQERNNRIVQNANDDYQLFVEELTNGATAARQMELEMGNMNSTTARSVAELENAVRNLEDFRNGLEQSIANASNIREAFENIGDWIKQWLKNMIAHFIANQITVMIGAQLGLPGFEAGLTSLVSGLNEGAASLTAGVGKAAGFIKTAAVDASAAFSALPAWGQAAGAAAIGYVVANATDAGSPIGVSIGTALGSFAGPIGALIGGAIGEAIGTAISGQKSIIAEGVKVAVEDGVASVIGYQVEKTEGGWFGSSDYQDIDTDLGNTTLGRGIQAVFDNLVVTIEAGLEVFGVEIANGFESMLDFAGGRWSSSIEQNIEQYLVASTLSGYERAFMTLGPELTAAIQDAFDINFDEFNVAAFTDVRDTLIGAIEDIDFEGLAEGLGTMEEVFEAAVDAVNRLVPAFRLAGIEIDGTTQQVAASAIRFMDAVGSTDEAVALLSNYITQIIPPAEQAATALGMHTDGLLEFNSGLDQSGDSLILTRAQLREYVDGLALSTDAGLEAAIAAMEMASSVAAVEDAMLATEAKFTAVQDAAKALNLTFDETHPLARSMAESLVDLMGGIDQFNSSLSDYFGTFYDENERAAIALAQAAQEVKAFNESLGLTGAAVIDTKEEFRAYVESLDIGTVAGQRAFAAAMDVAESMGFVAENSDSLEAAISQLPEHLQGAFGLMQTSVDALAVQFGLTSDELIDAGLSASQVAVVFSLLENELITSESSAAAIKDTLMALGFSADEASAVVAEFNSNVDDTVEVLRLSSESFTALGLSAVEAGAVLSLVEDGTISMTDELVSAVGAMQDAGLSVSEVIDVIGLLADGALAADKDLEEIITSLEGVGLSAGEVEQVLQLLTSGAIDAGAAQSDLYDTLINLGLSAEEAVGVISRLDEQMVAVKPTVDSMQSALGQLGLSQQEIANFMSTVMVDAHGDLMGSFIMTEQGLINMGLSADEATNVLGLFTIEAVSAAEAAGLTVDQLLAMGINADDAGALLALLSAEIKNAGDFSGVTVESLVDLGLTLTQAEDIMGALAIAGNDANTVLGVTTGDLIALGLSATEANGVISLLSGGLIDANTDAGTLEETLSALGLTAGEVDGVIDLLAEATGNQGTAAEDSAATMKAAGETFYAASVLVATAAGLSEEEIASLAPAMDGAGAAADGLGTDIGNLGTAASGSVGATQGLGTEIGNVGTAASGAIGATQGFGTEIGNVGTAASGAVGSAQGLATEVGNIGTAASNAVGSTTGLSGEVGNLGTAASNTSGELQSLNSALSGIGGPTARKSSAGVDSIAAQIRAVMSAITDSAPPATSALSTLGTAITTMAGTTAPAANQVQASVTTLNAALSTLGTTTQTQAGQVSAGATAISTALGGLGSQMNASAGQVAGAAATLSTSVGQLGAALSAGAGTVAGASGALSGAITQLGGALSAGAGTVTGAAGAFAAAITQMGGALGAGAGAIASAAQGAQGSLVTLASTMLASASQIGGASSTAGNAMMGLAGVIAAAAGAVSAAAGNVAGSMASMAGAMRSAAGAVAGASGTASGGLRTLSGSIGSVAGAAKSAAGAIAGAASSIQASARKASSAANSVDGSHATGLGYVPFDGYVAELHKGEMVIPSAVASFLKSAGVPLGDSRRGRSAPKVGAQARSQVTAVSEQILEEIRKELTQIRAANEGGVRSTVDKLDAAVNRADRQIDLLRDLEKAQYRMSRKLGNLAS